MADVLALADAVAAFLQQRLDLAGVTGATATREYEVQYDLGTFTGLKVHVLPVAYLRDGPATRRENNYDGDVVVVVAERYADVGSPGRDWLDARVQVVESCVFDPLEKIDLPLLADVFRVKEIAVDPAYDLKMLREKKVFWSEVQATFTRVRPTN